MLVLYRLAAAAFAVGLVDALIPHGPRVLVVDPAGTLGLQALESEGFQVATMRDVSDIELEHALPSYEAVVVRSANRINRQMMDSCPRLTVVGRAGSGTDNIDLVAAAEMGIPVVNSPTGNARSVAELVIGLMLNLARKLPRAHRTMEEGEWAKKSLVGTSLGGKTLGIIGFGSIGQEVARLASAFGMDVVVSSRKHGSIARVAAANRAGVQRATATAKMGIECPLLSLDDLLCRSDFVTLHTPLTEETRNLIGERELGLMKPSATLINTSRGGVVNERDLLACLKRDAIGGAAVDVFCSEKVPLEDHVMQLCRLENVVCTPHLGAATEEAGDLVLNEVCTAVAKVLLGTLPPEKVVSSNPNTSLLCAKMRLGIPLL